jgi:hypothetical protein
LLIERFRLKGFQERAAEREVERVLSNLLDLHVAN